MNVFKKYHLQLFIAFALFMLAIYLLNVHFSFKAMLATDLIFVAIEIVSDIFITIFSL